MVTVPKSNGKIRIGVDLTKLNEIQLKPDAQPFAIMTPRCIPLPMKSKVKEELATMDKLGVIRKVDKPTKLVRSRNRPRSTQDCSCRKDGETAKCCRTTKIPGNDRPTTEVHRKPVREDYATSRSSFASRSMTSTEQRYAQIAKEALATTWACEKFADFVLGKEFLIEMDHKPLVPLLGSKCLQDMPPEVPDPTPEKDLTTADTVSRAPLHRSLTKDEKQLNEDLTSLFHT